MEKKLSYTQKTKNEIFHSLTKINNKNKWELFIFLYLNNGSILMKNNSLEIIFENKERVHYFLKIYNHFFKNSNYSYDFSGKKNIAIITNIASFKKEFTKIDFKKFFQNPKNLQIIMKSVFLAFGNINNPQTAFYHLEFVFNDDNLAKSFLNITTIRFNSKIIKRRGLWVVYIKKSEFISNFLKFINAHISLLEFENACIQRDFLNSINRIHNMDLANLEKTIKASSSIITIIKKIQYKKFWWELNKKEKKVCLIRLTYPNFSLQEICNFYNKKYNDIITKSMVNHTFRKIKKLKEIKGKQR